MALINFVQLADAVDFDGVAVQHVWEAEDDETGQIVTMYFDIGTSPADAQSQMGDADTAEKPPPDPIETREPLWQYNTEIKEYCVFGDDGLKLFAIKRDAGGNAILTMFDTVGNPVVPGWIDLVRQGTNQNPVVTGTDILMSKVAGTLDYDAATGVVTLKAGKLYRLFATLSFLSLESGKKVRIEWVKALDNTPVSQVVHQTNIFSVSTATDAAIQNVIEVIYQPVLDEGVKLRCALYGAATDNAIMNKDYSMATVTEIR